MLRAIPLTGKWSLRPRDEKDAAEKCTSWFNGGRTLEIDTQNSILTSLLSAGAIKDERQWSSTVEWVIKRTFSWKDEEGLHALLKLPDARKIMINGKEATDSEIESLLTDGENTIEATVPGYFSASRAYIYTSKTGIVHSAHLSSERCPEGWRVDIELDYHSYRAHTEEVSLTLLDQRLEDKMDFPVGRDYYHASLVIPDEKVTRWQVNGDGKQNIYRAEIRIGQVELERKIAFRDIEVHDGRLFVEGKEFYAKGAVWPTGRFRDKNRINSLISSAVKANMNMLLIEKGHEEPYFYNICDQKGIIVLHGEDNPGLKYHPCFFYGDVKYDIFNSISHDANYFEHILDAVALERWVLKTRSNNDSTGIIYNNLLSTVTPEGSWKPSHYGTRRFYADLVPIMFLEKGKLMIHVSNDSDKDEKDIEISCKFMTYEGKKREKLMYTVDVPAHSAVKVGEYDIGDMDTKKEFVFMKLRTFMIHRELTLLLDNISSCGFVLPSFQTSVRTISPKSWSIRFKVNVPAFAVHLAMKGHESGQFSDSFFEVRPESEKSVVFNSNEEMTEEEVLENLEIYDLAHAIADSSASE